MEAGTGARRLVWVLIGVLGGALCYSIGFQSGWSEATATSDGRFDRMTESLREVAARVEADGVAGEGPAPARRAGRDQR